MLSSARNVYGEATLGYVEMRMAEGNPVTQIKSDQQLLRFDATTGEQVAGEFAEATVNQNPASERNTVKELHRMTTFGDWTLWINVVVSVALMVLIVTGLWMYFQLKSARARAKRSGWFWSAGGGWRSLHRWISLTSAVFLTVVALSGAWLAVESLGMGIYLAKMRAARPPGAAAPAPAPRPILPNGISALNAADAPEMLRTTLASYQSLLPDTPIRVVRLREFGGMKQGVIVTGEEEADQVVFNAVTGERASMTEPGYPKVGFPFGWEAHQIAKKVHRGDYFGMSGRWADLFAGLALIYLSISGVVMYVDMWGKRKRIGRSGLLWK